MMQSFSRADYDRLWGELTNGLDHEPSIVYMQTHKERFFEAFVQMAFYLDGIESPRVLEFGTSNFTILFKKKPAKSRSLSSMGWVAMVSHRLMACSVVPIL